MSHPEDFALSPARILSRPSAPRYQDENRLWQVIPSMAKAPGGTLYNVFYSGMSGEGAGNYVVCLLYTSTGWFLSPGAGRGRL